MSDFDTNINKIECPCCGEHNYKKIDDDKFECKICGTTYFYTSTQISHDLKQARTEIDRSEFHKADSIYKNILQYTDNEETKVICNLGRLYSYFGVKYLKDYDGNIKITISRYDPNFKSIKDLSFYKKVVESKYGNLYINQLELLDNEYKKLVKEMKSEEKYDLFICTKVSLKSTENPNIEGYTDDFVQARKIYEELKQKCPKMKIFFSEKTLSGIQYDAQIFRALIGSKKMLLIGTKREYLESTWVEREWKTWFQQIEAKSKTDDSLYFYTPKEFSIEVPSILQNVQRFTNPLDVINKIVSDYKKENNKKEVTAVNTSTLKEIKNINKQQEANNKLLQKNQKIQNKQTLKYKKKAQKIDDEIDEIKNKKASYFLKIKFKKLKQKIDKLYNEKSQIINFCKNLKELENIETKFNNYDNLRKNIAKHIVAGVLLTITIMITIYLEIKFKLWTQFLLVSLGIILINLIVEIFYRKHETFMDIYHIFLHLIAIIFFFISREFAFYSIPLLLCALADIFTFYKDDFDCSIPSAVGLVLAIVLFAIFYGFRNTKYENFKLVKYNIDDLTQYEVKEGTISIGDRVFEDHDELEKIILPESLTTISDHSFYDCSSLKSIYIPKNVSFIGDAAFFECDSLVEIIVDEENEYYKSIDGVLYTKDESEIIKFPEGKEGSDYVISDNTKKIHSYAFSSCLFLIKITIPDSVEIVGEFAFSYSSSLNIVYIGKGVKKFPEGMFNECENLNKIYYNGTKSDWDKIEKVSGLFKFNWDQLTGNYEVIYVE